MSCLAIKVLLKNIIRIIRIYNTYKSWKDLIRRLVYGQRFLGFSVYLG